MIYKRLGYYEFGQQLFETGDLDPVYIMLAQSNLSRKQMCRWLLAYWCFYHSGLCCDIVEYGDYWSAMVAACEPGASRASERRHFRGIKAQEAVAFLRSFLAEPEEIIDSFMEDGCSFQAVTARVQRLPLFGPWIAFKVADMLERILREPIDFSGCELAFYDEPRKGAALIETGDPEGPVNVPRLVGRLEKEFSGYLAPPWQDRAVNVQEIETILCKFKSHWKGHYPVGKDIAEVRHSLSGRGQLASNMMRLLP